MQEYTQEYIDSLIENADADSFDMDEFHAVLKLVVFEHIGVLTSANVSVPSKRAKAYVDAVLDDDSRPLEKRKELFEIVTPYYNLASYLFTVKSEQKATIGDYDRNLWRLAYVYKSIQTSELEKANDLPITDEGDLLENMTEDKLDGIKETMQGLINAYMLTEARISYIRFLRDYTQISEFSRIADSFRIDERLKGLLESEANNIKDLALDHVKSFIFNKGYDSIHEEDERLLIDIDSKLDEYKPLFVVPHLESIKLSAAKYDEIKERYINLSLGEVVEREPDIRGDFHEALIRGYYEDDDRRQ